MNHTPEEIVHKIESTRKALREIVKDEPIYNQLIDHYAERLVFLRRTLKEMQRE